MKTADDYLREFCLSNSTVLDVIKEVQLEAFKAGMTEAGNREPELEFEGQFDSQSEINAYKQGFEDFKESILTARDAKTTV